MYGSSTVTGEGRTVWYVSICCGAEILEDWVEREEE
jgi:hypothetical protein